MTLQEELEAEAKNILLLPHTCFCPNWGRSKINKEALTRM